jgi:hypothetical protein
MRIVTRQAKDLKWWRALSANDKEYFLAYDWHLRETEAHEFKAAVERINEAGKKKGFGIIVTLLYAIYKTLALALRAK